MKARKALKGRKARNAHENIKVRKVRKKERHIRSNSTQARRHVGNKGVRGTSFNTLIKLTQINELNYDCLSLLLLNSVIYQRLSSIFTSVKLM